jgi:hypothetical protein
MAISSELVDEESQDVGSLLNNLRVPSNFGRYEILEDKNAIAQLDEWKANALDALKDLRGLLVDKRDEIRKSDVIYTCARFQGDGDWTSEDIRALSSGKRSTYAPTEKPLNPIYLRNTGVGERALFASLRGGFSGTYQADIPSKPPSHA